MLDGSALLTGLGPIRSPPFRVDERGVDDHARPVELAGTIERGHRPRQRLLPHAALAPLVQAPPHRLAAREAELARQIDVAHPRVEQKQQRLEARPRRIALAARIALAPGRILEQPRQLLLPNPILDTPRRPARTARRPPLP